MNLIEYKETVEEAFRQGKNKDAAADSLSLIDIAHSLSIMAENSMKEQARYDKQTR